MISFSPSFYYYIEQKLNKIKNITKRKKDKNQIEELIYLFFCYNLIVDI